MNKRLIMLSGFLTLLISGLLPSYAFDITEPPVTLRTAANGLSLGKAQKNGQWVCLSYDGVNLLSGVTLYSAGTPWVNGLDVNASLIPYVTGSVWNGKSIFKTTISKKERRFKGNGLPNHKTGIYPVQEGTPAYSWYAAAPGGPGYSSSAKADGRPC